MKRLPVLVAVLLVVVMATAATAVGVVLANRDDDTRTRTGPGMMYPGSSSTPGWWDDSWNSMMGPMMMGSYAAASEPEYLAEMVAHHQEAVAAARELARSDRPQMRAFGESIVETQSAQIEQMTSWLSEWYPDTATTVDYRPMMRDLSGLSGDQLDRAFLEDMIGHHMGAVMLSQHLLWRGTDHDDVAQLARSIRDDQHAEIIQMQSWLAQWFDADWRAGMGRGMWSGQGQGTWMGPGMMGVRRPEPPMPLSAAGFPLNTPSAPRSARDCQGQPRVRSRVCAQPSLRIVPSQRYDPSLAPARDRRVASGTGTGRRCSPPRPTCRCGRQPGRRSARRREKASSDLGRLPGSIETEDPRGGSDRTEAWACSKRWDSLPWRR